MTRDSAAAPATSHDMDGDSRLRVDGFTEFLGVVAPAAERIGPGTRIGDVTIVRLIGEGGMGRVYEALQGMPCRTVAVKVVRAGVLSHAAAKRFEQEVQILGRLTHPGICRIYSVGLHRQPDGDVPFFVMEFIDDALPITARAAERGLSVRDRVQLFRDACGAVAHGHQKGIIHRDLKPGNILVDSAGRPKVIDFGVARSTDSDVALTTMHTDVGQLVGTLIYMAPEQFDGTADRLDVRADVYALGLVLYELLAGSLPYDVKRRAVHEVARIVRDVDPRSLSSVNPKLRGDLETIVTKCLEKERDRRYSNATELEADLGRYLRGEPIAASRPSFVDSIVRLARRHRLAAVAATAIAGAFLLAMTGISIFAVRAERQRGAAVAAEQMAMRGARVASEQRDAADRERARADSEATLARRRLYVANLRAIQSSLAVKNLRMARSLYDDNVALLEGAIPIEMRCLAACLDDAVTVFEPKVGPIVSMEYSTDGKMLSVIAAATTSTTENPRQLPHGVSFLAGHRFSAFAIGDDGRYERLDAPDPSHLLGRGPSPVLMGLARSRDVKPVDYRRVDASSVLAQSGDGRLMAFHAPAGGIRIVSRTGDGPEVVVGNQRGSMPARLAFSGDGTRLVTQHASRMPQLWDTGTGRLVGTCGEAGSGCEQYVVSPDGSRIAVVRVDAGGRRDVRIHDTADGRPLSTVTVVPKHDWGELILAFTSDGGRLISSFQDNDLAVFDSSDGTRVGALQGHAGLVTALTVSRDGRSIATGASNGHIRVWDATTLGLEQELTGHTASVKSIQFRDERTLASGSRDGTVRTWAIGAPTRLSTLPGISGLTAVVFSPDGRQLAVAPKQGGGVQLWNPQTVRRLHTLLDSGDPVMQLAYSPDGSLVAAAFQAIDGGGRVRIWESMTGKPVQNLQHDGAGIVSVAFSPDGTRVLGTSRDNAVIVWDVRTGHRQVDTSFGVRLRQSKTSAVFGLDGRRLACGRPELLDAETGNVAVKLPRQGLVSCLAVSRDGRMLATGVAIGSVLLTDFATGERLTEFLGHESVVRSIAFDGDAGRLLVGWQDGTVRVWDARRRRRVAQELLLLPGHEGAVDSVAFTPDGTRIITGSMDGTIRIWDSAMGHELLVLPGQRDDPRAFAVSNDGMHVVAAGEDGRPTIWALSNAEIFRARAAASAPIAELASPGE